VEPNELATAAELAREGLLRLRIEEGAPAEHPQSDPRRSVLADCEAYFSLKMANGGPDHEAHDIYRDYEAVVTSVDAMGETGCDLDRFLATGDWMLQLSDLSDEERGYMEFSLGMMAAGRVMDASAVSIMSEALVLENGGSPTEQAKASSVDDEFRQVAHTLAVELGATPSGGERTDARVEWFEGRRTYWDVAVRHMTAALPLLPDELAPTVHSTLGSFFFLRGVVAGKAHDFASGAHHAEEATLGGAVREQVTGWLMVNMIHLGQVARHDDLEGRSSLAGSWSHLLGLLEVPDDLGSDPLVRLSVWVQVAHRAREIYRITNDRWYVTGALEVLGGAVDSLSPDSELLTDLLEWKVILEAL
jgi:hypothetical protein